MATKIHNLSVVNLGGREIPKVPTKLCRADRLGAFKARWGVGRMKYTIEPGLYAVGNPNPDSIVLVTANYKLSFDTLRKELGSLNAWIMVLDTKGINVWCSAGKGTFGTDEIVRRVQETRLGEVVAHRKLIVPQLGAPGKSSDAYPPLNLIRSSIIEQLSSLSLLASASPPIRLQNEVVSLSFTAQFVPLI